MINSNQKQAINLINGPVLVLAGPGSGKTFVLTNRIFEMVYKHNIEPENILVITFTHKASVEMKERYLGLEKDYIKEQQIKKVDDIPRFGTFHSVFFEILRDNFGYSFDSFITMQDKEKYLVEVLSGINNIKFDDNMIKNVLQDIDNEKLCKEKNELFTPKYFSRKMFDDVRNLYEEKLFNAKKLDYYDMIDVCSKMLTMHNDVLTYYQNKYQYVLIDEFQDINKSQYDIVKLICKSKNLFVVGDDDQSIYKFRGSNPTIINDFKKDFPKYKMVTLNQNYRSAKTIVTFSKRVIDVNKKRVKKDLVSERKEYGKVTIKSFEDTVNENSYIIDHIKHKRIEGFEYKDVAILYRTNILSKALVEDFEKNSIPFEVKDQSKSFYDNMAIKDILAYLKISIGDSDSNLYMQVVNKPLRYISRNAIGYKNTSIDSILSFYRNNNYILKNVIRLKEDLQKLRNMHPTLAIRYIRNNIGYDKYLKEYCDKQNIDIEHFITFIEMLEENAIRYQNIESFINFINRDINNDVYVKEFNEKKDAVRLMTFHSSKGLEFRDVIIIDCNDGLIPHKKSLKQQDIETERRLFYVACTRAKDDLNIYFTKQRYGKNYKPSRFIMEGIGKSYV